ncbi:MAG: helix-turn-helix domain-containing protein [Alphaproteobacteria bacterium]|nr:helix-turn-helix domain-containing protein [Alphaproteobacteria bacterium]
MKIPLFSSLRGFWLIKFSAIRNIVHIYEAILITGRQIRAARALLEWDAEDLAAKAGLSRDTVFNIEKGIVQARGGSMEKIIQAFASNGIEFTDNQGVKVKPTGVDIYEGEERFNEFYDFLYEHLKLKGGEVCLSIADETLLSKYRKNPVAHYERMQDLSDRGVIKSFRILANKSNFASKYPYNTYKWQPRSSIAPTAFYTFGDCLALISFVHNPPPYVVVLQSAPIADSYRQAFDIAWAAAKEPPVTSSGKKKK